MRARFLLAPPAVAVAIALGAGPALAHECYIASRSWQGDLMAGTRSQAWYRLDLNVILDEDVSSGALTSEQADCLRGELPEHGVPMLFTVMVKGANGQDGVIAANNPNEWLMTNGKGVDHFFDIYGGAIAASFTACGLEFQV